MSITIDLVTHDPKQDAFVLVAVEQGPWPPNTTDEQLLRLQNKLLDYVNVAVDGGLAQRYPESLGKPVIIRLDSYDTPREQTEELFFCVAEYVHQSSDIQAAVTNKRYVAGLTFEINQRSLTGDA
jgi:hypothetical protein